MSTATNPAALIETHFGELLEVTGVLRINSTGFWM